MLPRIVESIFLYTCLTFQVRTRAPAWATRRRASSAGRERDSVVIDDDIAGTGQEGWVEIDLCSQPNLAELESGVGGAG